MIETGEQEIHESDLDVVDGIDPDEVVEPRPAARTGGRTARARRRRPSLAERVRGLDSKRPLALVLVVTVVVVAFVAVTLAVPLRNYYAGHSEAEQLAASNAKLREQVAYYQQKVNEQGDPAYVEAQARERLQFVRPGETPLVMMYPGDAEREAAQKRAEEHAHNPWYTNLWETVATPPE